jgi:uncharacterized protein
MRLALESDPNINLVRSYGDGVVIIGAHHIKAPCVVSPRQLLLDWPAVSVEALTELALQPLFAQNANIVLLGSGTGQQWPDAAIRRLCRTKGIALECMDLGAACRTYNILASEERAVVAGLFP